MSDAYKRAAAEAAVAMVEDGMVVGLGTGSTAAFAIDALIRRTRAGLSIRAIPTSERSASQARAGGIAVIGFDAATRIDLTIDGADEIAPDGLALIKGLGGALLREKIVAASSARMVVIADDGKLVQRLGERAPVPVEVAPFGWQATAERLRTLGAEVTVRGGQAPFRTDGGNMILDCRFPPIDDPAALEVRLRSCVGVFETGLFVGLASLALVAGAGGVSRLSPA